MGCVSLLVLGLLAPAAGNAQSVVGQPAPGFEFDVDNGRVTMEWTKEFGPVYYGHTLYASYSPGGPIIAQQYVPPKWGVDGVEPPFVSFPVVPPGTYYVLVVFGMAPPAPGLNGAWTRIDVGTGCTVAPNRPAAFWDAAGDGDASHVDLRWSEDEDGCPAEWFVMEAGSGPGLANIAILPLEGGSFEGYPPVGTYYLRLRAANRFGGSPPSDEIAVSVQGCDVPGAPLGFGATVAGHSVQISWSPPLSGGVETIIGYSILAAPLSPVAMPVRIDLSAQTTTLTIPNVPSGAYYLQMAARTSCPSNVGLPTDVITVSVP